MASDLPVMGEGAAARSGDCASTKLRFDDAGSPCLTALLVSHKLVEDWLVAWVMKTVGAFEAKTHLSTLLEQVEGGEEITITKHGKAVARLVPVGTVSRDRLENTVARLKAFRRGRRLDDLSAKALIEEGRR